MKIETEVKSFLRHAEFGNICKSNQYVDMLCQSTAKSPIVAGSVSESGVIVRVDAPIDD